MASLTASRRVRAPIENFGVVSNSTLRASVELSKVFVEQVTPKIYGGLGLNHLKTIIKGAIRRPKRRTCLNRNDLCAEQLNTKNV